MEKMAKIRVDDLEMRPDMFGVRLKRRAMLRNSINDAMPVIDKALSNTTWIPTMTGLLILYRREGP